MFKDKTLSCKDCGNDFVFSASEQEFYQQKGFENDPVRCPECRSARKANIKSRKGNSNFGRRPQRKMYTATCSDCGATTSVPFQPSGEKPVYCNDCYQSHRDNR